MNVLSAYLGNKDFMVGKVSVVDFEIVHLIDMYSWVTRCIGEVNTFQSYSNLTSLVNRIKSLPGVREFVRSDLETLANWTLSGSCNFD